MKKGQIKIDYPGGRFPSGMTVQELQTVVRDLDWDNGEDVAREVTRCNDRCRDNPVDADVKVSAV